MCPDRSLLGYAVRGEAHAVPVTQPGLPTFLLGPEHQRTVPTRAFTLLSHYAYWDNDVLYCTNLSRAAEGAGSGVGGVMDPRVGAALSLRVSHVPQLGSVLTPVSMVTSLQLSTNLHKLFIVHSSIHEQALKHSIK